MTVAEQQTQSMHELIKAYRRSRKLNQTRLAELVGVKQQTVSAWENDATEPTSSNLRRIASELELTTSEWQALLASADSPPETSKAWDVMRERMDSIEQEVIALRSIVERLEQTQDPTLTQSEMTLAAKSGITDLTPEQAAGLTATFDDMIDSQAPPADEE